MDKTGSDGKFLAVIMTGAACGLLTACSAFPLNAKLSEADNGSAAAGYVMIEREDIKPSSTPALPKETVTPMPTEESIVTITISAAGDCALGNYRGQEYAWSFDETYKNTEDKSYFLSGVKEVFSQDDFTLVNLEGPLTNAEEGREEQTYCIKGLPEYAKILTLGDVEGVTFANNHQKDYFEAGIRDTVQALENEGIAYAYGYTTGTYETKGVTIGWVSVNEVGEGAGVEDQLKKGIEKLKEEGADIIIACPHWGIEREFIPEDYQVSLGRKCIDWGADLVLGCHPHVVQSIELYNGHYIVYSMANFCFGANRNPPDRDTIIVQQSYTFKEGERIEASDISIIPCSVSSSSDRNDFRPCIAEGAQQKRIIDRLNEYSEGYGVRLDYDGNVIK